MIIGVLDGIIASGVPASLFVIGGAVSGGAGCASAPFKNKLKASIVNAIDADERMLIEFPPIDLN
ncbi:hypothetical protein [Herminiimonas fonticola]|uniref:hypothetical protein n=1 Tax=Herminiimonas fonticola TaxID=303380 RepID=UPI00333E6E30